MNTTLKQTLKKAQEFYTRHAEWERKKAEQATPGSNIREEMLRAAAYNEGRAKAMEEALGFLEQYLG